MKKKGFDDLLERYHSDPEFREQLQTDFDGAISAYNLSEQEKSTIRENVGTKRENYVEKALREIWDKYKDDILPRRE